MTDDRADGEPLVAPMYLGATPAAPRPQRPLFMTRRAAALDLARTFSGSYPGEPPKLVADARVFAAFIGQGADAGDRRQALAFVLGWVDFLEHGRSADEVCDAATHFLAYLQEVEI